MVPNRTTHHLLALEAWPGLSKTFKMESFARIVDDFSRQLLVQKFPFGGMQGLGYASRVSNLCKRRLIFDDLERGGYSIWRKLVRLTKLQCWLQQTLITTKLTKNQRSYDIVTENHFCVLHKNRRRRNQQLKLLFNKIIYILAHQAKYLLVRKLILLLINNV